PARDERNADGRRMEEGGPSCSGPPVDGPVLRRRRFDTGPDHPTIPNLRTLARTARPRRTHVCAGRGSLMTSDDQDPMGKLNRCVAKGQSLPGLEPRCQAREPMSKISKL